MATLFRNTQFLMLELAPEICAFNSHHYPFAALRCQTPVVKLIKVFSTYNPYPIDIQSYYQITDMVIL